MENNINKILKYKNWGMNLTPANYKPDDKSKDKKPVAVKNGDGQYKWNVRAGKTWSDDELVAALETKRLAVYHNPGKYNAPGQQFFDAESDDKTFKVNKYFNCFPETYTIGKKVNDVVVATHKLYKLPKNHKVKQYGYDDPIEGKKVELLCSGISVIDGLDRLVMDSREPSEADPAYIKQCLQLSTFLAELESYWPKEGSRDLAHFELAGALAKHTDLPLSIKKKFITRFLEITNDDEVDNRLNKYAAQEETFKNNPDIVVGIDTLAKRLGGNFKSFDELKREDVKDIKEEINIRYPLVDFRERMSAVYPEVNYILEPILTDRSTNEVSGQSGAGKTMFLQACAKAINSGHKFIDYKNVKTMPTAYIEGELPGEDYVKRETVILNDWYESNPPKHHRAEWDFALTRDDLMRYGLPYGFEPIAISRLSVADQLDYGRKGRQIIETWCDDIKNKTESLPFLFLDNITVLSDIDENRASDWTPIMQWTNHLKAKGIANLFVHHSNKSTGTSSGSSSKERMLDTHLIVEKLDPDHRFDNLGIKNVQCKLKVGKARNFGGSNFEKTCILTMDSNGKWTKYPDIEPEDFQIVNLYRSGITTAKELAQHPNVMIAEKTIYKHLQKLRFLKIIDNNKGGTKNDGINKQDTNGNAEDVF